MNYSKPFLKEIFPVPIQFNQFNRKFTTEEIEFVDKCSLDVIKNNNNFTSKNFYVLKHPSMKEIKNFLDFNIQHWVETIDRPSSKINSYITQSWFNYTYKGGDHFLHTHPNSFISGVFYINADRNHDTITFVKSGSRELVLFTKDYNSYNSTSYKFNVGSSDLVLFPSTLKHHVEKTSGDHVRISLAFNVFHEGILGNDADLTELISTKHPSYI